MQVRYWENSLRKFLRENFHCNRNVHNVSWYRTPNFLPPPHSIWCIDSQITGKGFLIILKKINGGTMKFLFLYPPLSRNLGTYVKESRCYKVFAIHHDLI